MGAAQFDHFLSLVLDQLDFKLDSYQVETLHKHYVLLRQWNKHINLTGIEDPKELVFRHFGESLAVAKVIGSGTGSVVDVGSGGGFPGVPVAVCWPDREVTLVESSEKKGVFLKEMARMQRNLAVFVGRLREFHARCEWATIRGVAPAEVEGEVGKLAQKVVLVVSAAKAPQAVERLGLAEVHEHLVPWDPRSVIIAGETVSLRVPRETGT